MGLLSRFKRIVKANVNASMDDRKQPEKSVDDFFRSLHLELGKIKAQTAAAETELQTATRALEESQGEINKLQRYAEKAAQTANDEDALKFLDRKSQQIAKHEKLQEAHNRAAYKAEQLQQLQFKLEADAARLDERRLALKAQLAEAKLQHVQATGTTPGSMEEAFKAVEEEANRMLDEAAAIAELNGDAEGTDLDERFKALEQEAAESSSKATAMSTEDELAAIKEKMTKKE